MSTKLLSFASGLLAFLCFCLTPLLPVTQTQTSLNWPQNNSLHSQLFPLISYSPQSLDISVPVKALTTAEPTEGHSTILGTLPTGSPTANERGLSIRRTADGVDVITRNKAAFEISTQDLTALPDTAHLTIYATNDFFNVEIPGTRHHSSLSGDNRPQIEGIFTDLAGSTTLNPADFHVNATIDSRYSSSPTPLKLGVMILGVLLTLISLVSLHRLDLRDGHGTRRFFPATWWKFKPLDGVVTAVIGFWYFFGANTSDDGYLLTMARASHHSGYMANYYRWFGVPESPFGAPYYDLLALLARINPTSTVMRLPELAAALLTWLLLTKEVIPRLGRGIAGRRVSHWSAAMVFLALWMAYNNGLRPEPLIALGSLLTWVCVERALATGRLLPAALAVFAASMSLSAGPTGLMAVAALLAGLLGVTRIIIRRQRLLGGGLVGYGSLIAPILASGTAVMVCFFGDQTLASVMESVRLRGFIGPSLHWYQEFARYQALFGQGAVDGSFPRRFAVFMAGFGLVLVLASTLRNGRVPGSAAGPSYRLTGVMIGTMFLMSFTPTKWSHHFGVYAGIGAAIAALAAVAGSHFAVRAVRNRWLLFGGTLFLMALAMAGINGWWYISGLGVPWNDKTIQYRHVEASTVVMVFSLLVMFAGVAKNFFQDVRETLAGEDRGRQLHEEAAAKGARFAGLAAAPIAIVCAAVVAFNCAAMAKGFVKQYPAYSVGLGNIRTVAGKTCQMADYVMVEPDPTGNVLATADGSPLKDSLTAGGATNFGPNNVPAGLITVGTQASEAAIATIGLSGQVDEQVDVALASAVKESAAHDDGASGAQAGSTGAQAVTSVEKEKEVSTGVNGSYAALPFGLDADTVPVVGSFRSGTQVPAEATTAWYALPEGADSPIIAVSAAGAIHHIDENGVEQPGRDLVLQFGRRGADGKVDVMGQISPLDPGPTGVWRTLRYPTAQIPQLESGQMVVRLHAVDNDLSRGQWLAFTPPRLPKMLTLDEYVGHSDPVFLEWVVALQFPCQRPFDHWGGVAEPAKFRISPNYEQRQANTAWMDYIGGGSLGLVENTSRAQEVPTYFKDQWGHDWGELDVLKPLKDPDGEEITAGAVESEELMRYGTWYPGPMNYENQVN